MKTRLSSFCPLVALCLLIGCSPDAPETTSSSSASSTPAPSSANTGSETDRLTVTVQLNHKLEPLDRENRYEAPLGEALQQKGFGEIDGGGTMQSKEGEIEFIDIHILAHPSSVETSIPFIIKFLEDHGAPKGSKVSLYKGDQVDKEIAFGTREGFGVYLDGINLPPEVYRTGDSNFVIQELDKLLAGQGKVENSWHGPTETALYIYGESREKMKELIAGFIDTYPLCAGARIVDLTP